MARFRSQFSGKEIDNTLESVGKKMGASSFNADDMVQLFFRNEADKKTYEETGDEELVLTKVPFNFTGVLYDIQILNRQSSSDLYFTTIGEKAEISVGFLPQTKGIVDVNWKEFIEDVEVTAYIDAGNTGVFTPIIFNQQVLYGEDFTIDVFKYLKTGGNRVKIFVRGIESKAESSLIFNATLTTMYLRPSNFTWYMPFIEGNKYNLGGMNIGGNLSKILHIKVTKEGYEDEYEIPLGTSTFITNAYVFENLVFPTSGTGVYNVDIWVEGSDVSTEHLNYNIMCIAKEDVSKAELVAINNISEKVFNFSENQVLEYCIYNKGESTGNPHILVQHLINTNLTTITDKNIIVNTSEALSLEENLEIETEEVSVFLECTITLGNEQKASIHIDNSKGYPAVPNSSFYLNPSMRSNGDANKETIVSVSDNREYSAEFSNMSWTENTDGWTVDNVGRKCLRIPAYSKVDINYRPLSNINNTKGKTIELLYKVSTVSNYNDPVITICDNPTSKSFRGIKITPKNILVHSAGLYTNDSLQDYNTTDEDTMHVVISIIYNYKTNYGNLVQIYVNGTKCRSFSFDVTDNWITNANVILGNNTSDLYFYKMRVYESGFGKEDAIRNYINCLPSTEEKKKKSEEINTPINDSFNVDYDRCVAAGLNTMVIEMLNGKDIPSKLNPSSGNCNLQINVHGIGDEIDAEMKELLSGRLIENQTIEGQGTTAMTYGRWNFRWKLGKEYNKRRITAKKNVASSMHSHKMGATKLFNYLHKAVIGNNEVGKNVAITQYPVYGFKKTLREGTTDSYIYEFIGLYTVGADKGDKETFGFNDKRYEKSLIHLEGSDHTPKSVGFDYPWNSLKFAASREGIGAINKDGNVVVAWEVGAAGEFAPDEAADEANVQTMLNSEFKDAYNVAYLNSPYILGTTDTLETINANASTWQKNYSNIELWTKGVYDLYYYNIQEQAYVKSGINVLQDVGISADSVKDMSVEDINNLIIEKRRERFKNNWGTYWNTEDSIFHFVFMLLFGATDNYKKNTYPYKFKLQAEGGKWRWRADDLDTIFDVNNQGLADKSYSILVGDQNKNGSGSIYRGDNSVLWTLINDTQKDEIKRVTHRIFDAMVAKAGEIGYGNNTIEQLIGCIQYFFWDNAQDYFPSSAYNSDSEWTYEDIWKAGAWSEVNPLSQSLGSHYEAEKDWVKMRMLFLTSYYNYGPFNAGGEDDATTGQLAYGGAGAHTFKVTPTIDFNPTVLRGSEESFSTNSRVFANTIADLNISDTTGADTRIYVQGLDWYSDIGDLSKLKVSQSNPSLNISSKRLQKLVIGNENPDEVLSNVQTLTLGNCPSLEELDVRNLKTLSGALNLDTLPRLQKALLKGTNITSASLPAGSKISDYQIPDTLISLSLVNNKFLKNFEYGNLSKLNNLRIENCEGVNGYAVLKDALTSENSELKYIRTVGFTYDGTGDDLTLLSDIADNADWYKGIDQAGVPSDNMAPIIEGTINVEHAYQDDVETIQNFFSKKLVINNTGGYYIKFEDPEFQKLIVKTPTEGGYGDGIGVTQEKLDGVKTISGFTAEGITDLTDLNKFSNLTTIADNVIKNSTVVGVTFESSAEINAGNMFADSTNSFENVYVNTPVQLKHTTLRKSITNIFFKNYYAFFNSGNGWSANVGNSFLYLYGKNIFIDNKKLGEDIKTIVVSKKDVNGKLYLNNLPLEYDEIIFDGNFTKWINIGNTKVKKVRVPNGFHTLGQYNDGYFYTNSAKMEEFDLNGIKNIDVYAFYRGGVTNKIFIPSIENLLSIVCQSTNHTNPFISGAKLYIGGMYNENKLADITDMNTALSNWTGDIRAEAFRNLTQLEGELVIPSNITNIGNYALCNCNRLSKVTINSKGEIGSNAFADCTGITELLLGDNITKIGGSTFNNCKNIQGTLVIPNATTTINNYAFQHCSSFTNIVIGNGVINIGTHVFNECSGLSGTLTIPDNVQTIGTQAFRKCNFSKIIVGNGITRLESDVFYSNLNLEYVSLGENISYIGSTFYNCNNIKVFICNAVVPPETVNLFLGAKVAAIYVPSNSVEAYKTTGEWINFADKIFSIDDYNLTINN